MKPTIEFTDFAKLDLRIGKVMAAVVPEWSEKLIQLTVDLGPEIGERTILAGIKQWYEPDDLVGNWYVFAVNLAEKKMGEGVSQGMLLAADGADHPVPLTINEPVAPGTTIR
ncbi:MAG: TRNA-binding protein [Candidatus Pacebacteria bacterium GW2011_GWA1_46_10]|nr:MAG: TRNA-binding protein [Candidatus Pacebacteria bacterium GW2011_GWA1_46_10]HCR81747.1 methionine--tRNA ligase [Candidatus Paceibacterota bacterium]